MHGRGRSGIDLGMIIAAKNFSNIAVYTISTITYTDKY